MTKIGLTDYVCSIMSGLGIKNPLQELRVGIRLHDVWLKKNWLLEHGQKLLKCQEKSYSVHKMQENAWRPGLRPGPRWESLQRSPRSPSWWGGAASPLHKNLSPALGPSGFACPRPLILEPPS